MSEPGQRRIVVVGGGTAGWMTAAALGRFCLPGMSVTLVESDEIGIVGVGEATIPSIKQFNDSLGIDEAEFLAAAGGTYKLGIAFDGWGHPNEAYVHAFGLVGSALGVVPFHHYWLRGRKLGIAKALGHYILHTIAIAGNRFAHVQREPGSVLPPLPYAYHFDASLYAKFLRGFAEKRGVVRQEGKIVAVERNQQNGDVAAVLLANGTRIEGDLFVDCSGFRGLLIEQELEAGFEDWSEWLQCDRAIAVPCTRVEPLLPLTRVMARKAGWASRNDFNARTRCEMERIRDFIILHYHANQRVGQPFWDELRTMSVPDSLQHRIDLFRATARVSSSFDELFDARAWIFVMIGQNFI